MESPCSRTLKMASNGKHMSSRVYGSGSRLARVTLRLILYLWWAGVCVARKTYRYSAQIKKTGNNLWPRRGAGMLAGRRGLAHLSAMIPHLKTSWHVLKCMEKKMRTLHSCGSSAVPLKLATQQFLSIARAASHTDGGTWRHRLKRLTGLGLAAKAFSHLSKISRRTRLERRRSDRRKFLRGSPRVGLWKSATVRDVGNKESASKADAAVVDAKSCVSWGELIQQRDNSNNIVLKQYNNRMSLYKKVPWKTISRMWGQFNQVELPKWLRKPALSMYIWMFNCSLEDAAVQDLKHYRNLSEFFRRKLRAGIRPLDGAHILTSPADGRVLNCGLVNKGALEQVKGVTYSLVGFLGPLKNLLDPSQPSSCSQVDSDCDWQKLLSNPCNKLYHCIIYLAPGDYHRFHSPTDWNVYARRHFPGELFSVNPGIARWLQGLFSFNERAVYSGKWTHGFFSMTAVGATNVGSINVYFDEGLVTNTSSTFSSGSYHDRSFSTEKKRSVPLMKGQPFGDFNLGSTIVLLFEAPENFRFSVRPGQQLKYGQGLGGCSRQLENGGIGRKRS